MFWNRKKKRDHQEIHPDYIELTSYYKWLIKDSDLVEFGSKQKTITLSTKFKSTFPILTKLILKARILNLKINKEDYKLFGWTSKNNVRYGWINKFEKSRNSELKLITEHRLLLDEIGGIWESFNQPEPSLTLNQEFLFIESECMSGIGGWDEYYELMCEEYNLEKIDYDDFVCFVREANGDVTLYNPENKEVFLFAHDHSYDDVEFIKGQPEYTFHKINNVDTFVDYVEKLAYQWSAEID